MGVVYLAAKLTDLSLSRYMPTTYRQQIQQGCAFVPMVINGLAANTFHLHEVAFGCAPGQRFSDAADRRSAG